MELLLFQIAWNTKKLFGSQLLCKELEEATFLAFSCPKLRFWAYFFQIAWNTKKLFGSKLPCSEFEVVPFWVFSCSTLRFWNYFFSDCLEHKKAFRFKVAAEGPGLKPSSPLQSIYFFLCPVVPTGPSFPDIRKEGCRRRPSSGKVAKSSKGAVLRGLTLERRGKLTKVSASCELMLLEEDSLKVRWASERLPRGSLATFWRKCPLQRSASSPKEEKREAGRQACCDEGANS